MKLPDNCTLVIFGASGDLTQRKLVPALFDLYQQNVLPKQFAVLGVSRTTFSDEAFQKRMIEGVKLYSKRKPVEMKLLRVFSKRLYYQSINTNDGAEYEKVKARLSEIDRELKTGENYIFYVSTPPSMYGIIPQHLGAQGLQHQGNGDGWKRIIIEKPFGYNLDSARALNAKIQQIFQGCQIYRIDHYLGKETVQNMLAFRFSNGIFEPLWNQNFIHHVEVTAAESIGVENRGGYYDECGALRDMVQNHLLQVLGTIAMEPPASFDADGVRNETVKVFQSLRPINPEDVGKYVVRGQYTESIIHGEKVLAYRSEKNVALDSRAETYVALKLYIDNWRWGGVPFYIRTGKRLPTRVTEVVIYFKQTPHHLFTQNNLGRNCNQLIIWIQPDEGILLKFGMKMPGAGFQIEDVNMDFHYSDLTDAYLPSAYERLLLDCMLGDATLYTRADAVEACWRFVDPILKAWKENPNINIYGYPAGAWGPKEARYLFDNPEEDWRYQCKDLVSDGVYCRL